MLRSLKRQIEKRRAMAGAVLALAIKASGAVTMLLILTLCSRSMSTGDFGAIAVWFNALSCLAVFGVAGQDNLIVRSWGEYVGQGKLGLARGAYRFGWVVAGLMAATACLALLAANSFLPSKLSGGELAAACAFLAAQILLHYSSHSCRTLRGFRVSEVQRELTARVFLLFAVATHVLGATRFSIFFASFAAGMVLSILIQTIATLRAYPADVAAASPRTALKEWAARGFNMCVNTGVEAVAQYAEVILLGLLVTPAAAAGYFVAARIANIFPMLASGLHTYTVTFASRLHYQGDSEQLQGLLRSVMTVAFALIAPSYVLLMVFGGWLLALFGPGYGANYPTLAVLATACVIITLSGPASGMMMMTGGERLSSRISLGALAIRLAATAALATHFGGLGAAVSWALINAPVAVLLSVLCRRRCGVDPSVLCIFMFDWERVAIRARAAVGA